MTSGTNPYYRFESLEISPPARSLEPHWTRKWGERIVSGAGAVSGLAIRAARLSPASNAISSLGIAFCAQWLTDSFFDGEVLSRVHQFALSMLGQMPLFLLTQLFDNVDNLAVQAFATEMIVLMLGSHLAIYARQMKQRGLSVRIESEQLDGDAGKQKLLGIFMRQHWSNHLKLAAAGISALPLIFQVDPVVDGVCSFFTCFYVADVVGETASNFIEKKIQQAAVRERSLSDEVSLTEMKGTKWRVAKLAVNTLGFLAIPLSFIPFTSDAHSDTRIAQLYLVGLIVGFFDGFMARSLEHRITTVPLERLEEVHNRPPVNKLAFKVWQVSWPLLNGAAITGFFIWQEGWDLQQTTEKVALGLMFGGFGASFALANLADRSWRLEERVNVKNENWKTLVKDQALRNLFLSPRIFGVNPAHFFFVGTNALRMDDRALETTEKPVHQVIICGSWLFYGIGMGLEAQQVLSEKRGTFLQMSTMLGLNAVLTFQRKAAGEIP